MGKDRSGRAIGVARRIRRRAALPIAVVAGLLLPANAMAAETEITGGPADGSVIINDSPAFAFSSPDGVLPSFQCRIDSDTDADFQPCESPKQYLSLTEGPHQFEVRASDLLTGTDESPATRSFIVDTIDPVASVDSGPDGPTRDNTPRFDFSSDEPGSTFECRIDGTPSDFAPCEGPGDSHIVAQPLSDGPHTFVVRATDAAGNTGAAVSRNFTVDTANPNTAITAGPNGLTGDNTPTFGFSSDEPGSTFECRIDDDDFAPCTNPHTTAALTDGPHNFVVRAVDAAGNRDENPASRTFTVDATPPNTAIDSGPVGTVADAKPTFTFSSNDGVRFQCAIDAGAFAACSGPGDTHTPATPLADGNHTFRVRAFDAVDNVDPTPAVQTFTVDTSLPPDTTAPETKITKRPKGKIKTKKKKARVKVAFRSEEGAAFTCRLDKGKYEPCTSPYSVKAKAKSGRGKKHSVSVRATDSAGNTGDAAVVSFRVLRAPHLRESVARRTVAVALQRHGYARRVVKALSVNCQRRSRTTFKCRFSSRFSGYRLKGSGEVKLRAHISYRFRVKAQGVRFTLTDENEKG
jgi:Big-like domain-containing protein